MEDYSKGTILVSQEQMIFILDHIQEGLNPKAFYTVCWNKPIDKLYLHIDGNPAELDNAGNLRIATSEEIANFENKLIDYSLHNTVE